MATKNSFPKKECDTCGRMISVVGMTAHKKTDLCKSSKESKTPFQPNNDPEVLKIYSNYNRSKREREIEAIGLEEVQKKEREKKQAQRAKKKEGSGTRDMSTQTDMLGEGVELKRNSFLTPDVLPKAPKRNQNKIPKPVAEPKPKGEQSSKAKPEPTPEPDPEPPVFQDKKEFLQEFLKVTNSKRAPSKWMKETTADVYITDFTKFANLYTGSEVDYSNLTWLQNVDKVTSYLNSKWRRPNGAFYAPATKKNMLLAFGSVASMLGMKTASSAYNDFATQINESLKKTS